MMFMLYVHTMFEHLNPDPLTLTTYRSVSPSSRVANNLHGYSLVDADCFDGDGILLLYSQNYNASLQKKGLLVMSHQPDPELLDRL